MATGKWQDDDASDVPQGCQKNSELLFAFKVPTF